MESLKSLLAQLWNDYAGLNPQAMRIHQLLEARGEKTQNDHIALRTFNLNRINITAMAKTFLELGYLEKARYDFPEKKLSAVHFENIDATQPKIFISELRVEECSQGLRSFITNLVEQVTPQFLADKHWCAAGRPWQVDFKTYQTLEKESDYAAWLAAFGFRANHFTVNANALKTFKNLQELNAFLKLEKFILNTSGGEIKGAPGVFLEQSSTMANEIEAAFTDGQHAVPGCYYEFAYRYALPNGKLFQGFNANSANKIFESTDRQRK